MHKVSVIGFSAYFNGSMLGATEARWTGAYGKLELGLKKSGSCCHGRPKEIRTDPLLYT